jgi:regulator of sirC expression with transglutaminase-like and TPR domain
MTDLPPFTELAAAPDPPLDLLALALAAEFRGEDVDVDGALGRLDALGAELADVAARKARDAVEQVGACAGVLCGVHGFTGATDSYDHPDKSMLDLVLETRRGLPILLSVVYVEVARRAGIPLVGVGLPGHFVAGHFGASPPLLVDPFNGGVPFVVEEDATEHVQPWRAHDIAMRMLNNLVRSYDRRGLLNAAMHAADLRLALPSPDAERERLEIELRGLRARFN